MDHVKKIHGEKEVNILKMYINDEK
jgi:hypothetical protein